MNVYRFINSKDIREHLESVKYPFGSLEAAWIIYQCRFASLEEKHAAWRELIRTMPDCAIEERPNTEAHDSLHRFLAEYMERETKLLHTFCENDGGVYRWMECQEDGARFEHPGIYSDYAKCRNRISREISDGMVNASSCAQERRVTFAKRSRRILRVMSREVVQAIRFAAILKTSASAALSTIRPPQRKIPPRSLTGTYRSRMTDSIHGSSSSTAVPENLIAISKAIIPALGRM